MTESGLGLGEKDSEREGAGPAPGAAPSGAVATDDTAAEASNGAPGLARERSAVPGHPRRPPPSAARTAAR